VAWPGTNGGARAGGLLAVAVLPGLAGISPHAYDHPALLSTGFHHAVLIAAALCALGGVLSALLIGREAPPVKEGCQRARDEDAAALRVHCAVVAPHARP